MISTLEKARRLSDRYYNRGLAAAHARDLTGAVRLLQNSLRIRKDNTDARDLLGLVCFETGEIGSAIKQWTISRELDPGGERAPRYLDDLQKQNSALQTAGTALARYNRALENSKQGNDDVAMVELRRALTQNPQLVKGWQLMALLEMKNGRFAQARRLLARASKIDTLSPLTRHLEVIAAESRQGEERRSRRTRLIRRAAKKEEPESTAAATAKPRRFFLQSGVLNTAIGAAIGILAMGFLFVPAKIQRESSEANARIVEYTNTIAEQDRRIGSLQAEIREYSDTVAQAEEELSRSSHEAEAYVHLLEALQAYDREDIETAGDAIIQIDESLLGEQARGIYNSIIDDVTGNAYTLFSEKGLEAFDGGDYTGAIPLLEKALAIEDGDYTVLNRLAHAYRYTGDAENALKYFQRIVDLFPDSHRAESVMPYLEEMQQAVAGGASDD